MAKKSKLFAALDAHQGKDHKLEKEKKKAKKAEREKRHKQHKKQEEEGVDEDDDEEGGIELNGVAAGNVVAGPDDNESEDESIMLDAAELDDSNTSGSEQDEEDDIEVEVEEAASDEDGDSDDDSIALSDLSAEQEDILPHQRLTIDNHAALLSSLHRIALPLATLSFTEHQSITSSERTAASIPAVDDDLARELAFYKQSLDAAVEARAKLIKDSVPFSRPADYFAEMVKTDEHMGKVKQKLVDAAAGKKAAAEARKQRDLKKFGKQVQVAKLQERDKAKRETLDKIQLLKRKRQQGSTTEAADESTLFDVALDDAATSSNPRASKRGKDRGDGSGPNSKRQKRDSRYGHGGKKRFGKSGDAASSGDLSGFSAKAMKTSGGAGGSKRLGKSRRMKGK